jgi:hypothetical protein
VRDLEMAFLAKITASVTHEIANSLAIILESAGLLSDILSLSQEGDFPHREKFQRVLGNINDQVKRGVDISSRLNQFAHSMDEPLAEVNLAHSWRESSCSCGAWPSGGASSSRLWR